MKYWLDTEFIEDGKTIDLISIGVIAEDDREFYRINQECCFKKANDWVLDNVLIPIGIDRSGWIDTPLEMSPRIKQQYLLQRKKQDLKHELIWFLKKPELQIEKDYSYQELFNFELQERPEIWGYYCDYDWVVFCQLFGKMIDLPIGFCQYCLDVKQEARRLRVSRFPIEKTQEHNALEDAKWIKKAWEFLNGF